MSFRHTYAKFRKQYYKVVQISFNYINNIHQLPVFLDLCKDCVSVSEFDITKS